MTAGRVDVRAVADTRDAFVRAALLMAHELGAEKVLELANRVEQARPGPGDVDADRRRQTAYVLRLCS